MRPGQALFTDPTGTMRHSMSPWHGTRENSGGDKRLEDVLDELSSSPLSSILSDIL